MALMIWYNDDADIYTKEKKPKDNTTEKRLEKLLL